MQKISTNTLTTRKHVEIDGHPYTVRKFGAGEQLRLNQLLTEATKLQAQLSGPEPDEKLELKALGLGHEMIESFVKLFDDGADGVKSRALIESLSQEEVGILLNQIFENADPEPEKPTEAPIAEATDSNS